MEQSIFLEEIDVWEHPPQSGITQTEVKNKKFFIENQTDLLQPLFETHRGMMRKMKNDFWSITVICRHHVEPRVKLYMPNSIMPEDYVVFTSQISRKRNSSISWKMLVESWRFLCQLQCLVKLQWTVAEKPVAVWRNTRQTTFVLSKLTNLWSPFNLVHKFIPMPQTMKIPDAKAAVKKKRGK